MYRCPCLLLLLVLAACPLAVAGAESACGEPTYDPAARTALYVWRDCPSNNWHLRATSGEGWVQFEGDVSSAGFSSVEAIDLEASDVLDSSVPDAITFRFGVSSPWQDGFRFGLRKSANACIRLTAPAGATVRVGSAQEVVTGAFDTRKLAPCGSAEPSLAVDDVTVVESDATAAFVVHASGSMTDNVTVDYRLVAGSASAGSDFVANSGTLVFSAGVKSQSVLVDVIDDSEPEGTERFTLELSNASNATIADAVGTATIIDDDNISACGAPPINYGADRQAFVWKDCGQGTWRVRVSAGAGDFLRYEGTIRAAATLSNLTPVKLEASDLLEQPDSHTVEFSLGVSGGWFDGFDVVTGSDAGTCFALTLPTGTPVLVGPNRVPRASPFDLGTLGACDTPPPSEAYNIVVVFTDDQRFDTLEQMPNVRDRLLPRGVQFDNAYVPTPLCCPARASTYSGGFLAQNTGVLDNTAPNGGMAAFDDRVNIGTRLQNAGYRTLFVGKWLNDYPRFAPYVPPGWNTFVGRSVGATVTDWSHFRYVTGTSGQTSNVGTDSAVDGQYHVYFERDRIISFIRGTAEPFMVFWSTTPPHSPATPAWQDQDAFPTFRYRGRGYDETDLSDKPDWVQNYTPPPDSTDELVRDQLRSLLSVDRSIGAIIDELEAQGELERTLFIVTSDNGYLWGEHGLWGKNKPYEESLRVPLLVVVPGIDARRDDHLVSAVLDLAPTLYDVVGINAESDGMSLLPLIEDPTIPGRNELFFEKFTASKWVNGMWAGVRRDNWKYTEYFTGEAELYDLDADPFELDNRAQDPAYGATRAELAARVEAQVGLAIRPIVNQQTNGRVGRVYHLALQTWGGQPPMIWALANGTLPPGLSLDSATGEIQGTPTTAGSWTFAVRVTSSDIATQTGQPKTFQSHQIKIQVLE